MGLYAKHIFPRLMDGFMGRQEFQRLRQDLLTSAEGDVLEIGFGTGLNLAWYPQRVLRLRAVDPAPLLPNRVAKRSAAVSRFPLKSPAQRRTAPLRQPLLRLRGQHLDPLYHP